MELQKQPKTEISATLQALQKILPEGMVVSKTMEGKIEAISSGDFLTAHKLLPSTVEKAVEDGLPMAVVSQACSGIVAQIEFEIIQLLLNVNVDQRLTIQAHQVPMIAQELYNEFKNDSIEDIAVCLKRGAINAYGDIYRLDGAVIAGWMRKYLDEKYDVLVSKLNAEKENFYQVKKSDRPEDKPNPERNLIALLEVVNGQREIPESVKKHLKPWQLAEIEFYQNTTNIKPFDNNEYFREKLEQQRAKRQFQKKLDRESSEFYKSREHKELKTWEDDHGYYVIAETLDDAEKIYLEAENQFNNESKKQAVKWL